MVLAYRLYFLFQRTTATSSRSCFSRRSSENIAQHLHVMSSTTSNAIFQRIRSKFTPKRVRTLKKMAVATVVSSIPVGIWWQWSWQQRLTRLEDVRTKVRVPNVQTIDDIMIERCRPGDVLLFDRRWEHCASGPLAALVCLLAKRFLCFEDPNKTMMDGQFDHCGT